MESLLHLVTQFPKAFLVRILVEMLLEGEPTDKMWATKGAIRLGVNCLRNEADKTRYAWSKDEDPAMTVMRAHLANLLPFIDDVVNSDQYNEAKGRLIEVAD